VSVSLCVFVKACVFLCVCVCERACFYMFMSTNRAAGENELLDERTWYSLQA